MIEVSSPLTQSLAVFGALALILVYVAYRLAAPRQSRNAPITNTVNTDRSYQTPDDWSEDTPLRLCGECGTFNHTEYRFCRECTGELRTARMVSPHSVTRLKNEVENRQ